VSWYQDGKTIKTDLDFTETNRQWLAVSSAGPCASLHLALDRYSRQHPTIQFFTGWMPLLPPNQQRQSTEGSEENYRLVGWSLMSLLARRKLQMGFVINTQ